MPDTRDRYATVTVTLTRRQAEALLSCTSHADVYYEGIEMTYGRLDREESIGKRVLDRAADRLRDALNGGAR